MPYDKLFETIKRNKLTNVSSVDKAILHDIPLSALIDLAVDLGLSIEAESSPPSILGLQDYHFLANSNMSGLYESGCTRWKCRLQRVDRLSRFATLYSDAVYIQSYFDFLNHVHIPEDPYQEYHFRMSISGSIKIINAIKPLIQNGVVKFLPAGIALCMTCYAQFMQRHTALNAQLNKQIRKLEKLYSETTSANLRILSAPSSIDGHIYEIHVTCDEDLFDHGNCMLATPELPPILLKKTLNKPSLKEYQLSRSDILRAHVNRTSLETIAMDLSCLQFHCSNSNLKYLTDRTIDISLLQATTQEDNLLKYNDVLSSQLIFEMPVFSNISLSSLLKIRANEYDAFTSYRETINHLVNEYIAQGRQLSPNIAKQIYSDIIQPKVLALDKRISSIRRSAIRRSLTNLAISAGSLTFGLCGNFLPSSLQGALIGAGLVQAINTVKSLPTIINAPSQLRNHNFYFVWKLSKMSKVLSP
jgi:hypothetical protein